MLDAMLGLQLEIAELDLRLYDIKSSGRENSDEYKTLFEIIETKRKLLDEFLDSLRPTKI